MERPGSSPSEVGIGDVGSYRRNVTGPLLQSSAEGMGLGLTKVGCSRKEKLWGD